MATISLQEFLFNKERKTLHIAASHFNFTFPDVIDVVSHHTGNVVRFVQDEQAALKSEFWDGEMMEYVPSINVPHVEKMIVLMQE